jgi:hypothetical protein
MPAVRAADKATKRTVALPQVTSQAGIARGNARQAAFDYDRMLSLAEASVIIGISPDGLRRHYRGIIRQLSPRRVGIRLRDALAVGGDNNAAA